MENIIAYTHRSIIHLVNENGEVMNEYSYDPFGKVLHRSEKLTNGFQYLGQYGIVKVHGLDDMYHMRARCYDAEHGRFISSDPLGEVI